MQGKCEILNCQCSVADILEQDPDIPEDAPLIMPDVLVKSNLHQKVSGKLTTPYNTMTTFFFRRSVEKAFQLDEFPSGLSLSMHKTIDSNPPYIMSAVDDIMYIVNTVLKKSLSTAQRDVVGSVVPAIGRVLGSDFVVMIQRKMRDEYYPKALVQGGFPPEDKIVHFIVLINSLDMANEYLARIVAAWLDTPQMNGQTNPHQQHLHALKDSFPFGQDATFVSSCLKTLETGFTSKTSELLNSGIQVLYNQVIKPRLRLVLTETFRDVDYSLTEEEIAELVALSRDDDGQILDDRVIPLLDMDYAREGDGHQLSPVAARFERGWEGLMKPIARLMTPRTFASVLDMTTASLARGLENRAWGYGASSSSRPGGVTAYGAIRMERDFLGIVRVVSRGENYAVREGFARMQQILTVANMDEEEWEEINAEDGDGGGMQWLLSEEERRRARNLVRG